MTTILETLPVIEYHIRGIPSESVSVFWKYAEPYIKRALDHTSGELTSDDLRQCCINKDAQLWLVSKDNRVIAAVTTEIVNYPRRRHCRVITLAGSNADDWTYLMDEALVKFAHQQKCAAIEAFVRKGYVPKLAQYGFKHKYSSIVKELYHE